MISQLTLAIAIVVAIVIGAALAFRTVQDIRLLGKAAPAAPQAEPKREPLSDERIDELMERLFYHRRYEANRVTWEDVLAVVRATEHAHGIGGSDAE